MIDFHTHILPGVDDGSKEVEESLEMLHMLHHQGVSRIVASPHFYAYRRSIEMFLNDRNTSFEKLKPHLDKECPQIVLGAEVFYFAGIGRCKDLEKLKIEGTDLVLLEMPFESWSREILEDIESIISNTGLEVVLAHVDRYLQYKKNKHYIKYLLSIGVKLQVNNEALKSFRRRRWVIKQLKRDNIFAFGSDCHNTKSRKPNWNYLHRYCNRKNENYIQELSEYCL